MFDDIFCTTSWGWAADRSVGESRSSNTIGAVSLVNLFLIMTYVCPVCGFPELKGEPRSSGTGGGSDEICSSCGFQFGFTDDDRGISYDEWRSLWKMEGMPWKGIGSPPEQWNPEKQLKNLTGPKK
jgi:ribosomal protein L37E